MEQLRADKQRLETQLSELQSTCDAQQNQRQSDETTISRLEADNSRLQNENAQLKESNNANNDAATNESDDKARERRFKFEMDELRHKFESQIKTLNIDKQRLEAQLASQPANKPEK